MDNNNVLKMLKDELKSKVDEATFDRLKSAKSSEEALSILEGVSVKLDDDMLAAVTGGSEDMNDSEWDEGDFDWKQSRS